MRVTQKLAMSLRRKEDALLFDTPALEGAVLEDVSVNSVQKKIKRGRCDWVDAAHGLGGTFSTRTGDVPRKTLRQWPVSITERR